MPSWIDGPVFDRYMDGDILAGTVMEAEQGRWFWHRYNPEDKGYKPTKEEAKSMVTSSPIAIPEEKTTA